MFVAMMILVERGLVSLDDPLSKFELALPSWSEKITVRHLLNYSSGIPKINYEKVMSDDATMKALRELKELLFEPGTSFNYNNNSVFLQRRIIEKVTGKTFEEFVHQNIVQPLNMSAAVFDPEVG